MKRLIYFTAICVSLLVISCASVTRQVERGDYDDAIRLATKKLAGDKKKKDEYVVALEKGFDKANRQDMANIDRWSTSNHAEDWESIIHTANRIAARQARIEPLLPLVSDKGYKAKFTFVDTGKIINSAKDKVVSLYEERLVELVQSGRNGNKISAREAYTLLNRMQSLNGAYVRPELKEEMRQLGTSHILVTMENHSQAFIPNSVIDDLLSNDYTRFAGEWNRFYINNASAVEPDFNVLLDVRSIDVTPDGWQERRQDYVREVVDGWEYVLDARGNVAKDSLGNDIKKDKWIRVNATVVEKIQSKRALVRTRLEINNVHTGEQICSEQFEVEEIFNHISREIYGDARALEPNMRGIIPPVPFPSESDLIRDAFIGLKSKFISELRYADYSVPFRT